MGSIKSPPVFWIPAIQLAILTLICLVAIPGGKTLVYSLALGGVIHIVPNLYFVGNAFRFQGARMMPQVLRALARGEAGKFLLTMAGFAVVFVMVKPLHVIAVFAAYLAMTVVHLVTAWYITRPPGG